MVVGSRPLKSDLGSDSSPVTCHLFDLDNYQASIFSAMKLVMIPPQDRGKH